MEGIGNEANLGVKKRIAVVGAGVSGLCSVKSCLESGLEPVCFEQSDDIGGLWRYKPGTTMQGEGTIMKATTINTSKEIMAYSDFPPPSHFYSFMHHTQLMEYLRLYADHFNIVSHIRFRQRIVQISKCGDYETSGRWDVSYKDTRDPNNQTHTETFDGVMICSGHHSYPYIPTIPGQDSFKGTIIHAKDYRTPAGCEDKTVVVVGMGNSGGDIAVELGFQVAKKVYLSVRRGVWVFHRNSIFGTPFDYQFTNRMFFWFMSIAPSLVDYWTKVELNRRMEHFLFGINPQQGPFSSHPFVNDDLPRCITSGAVTMKPGIDHLDDKAVHFTDGTFATDVDIIFVCTGYTLAFPFLEEGVIDVNENAASLYKHMYPPHLKHRTLAVVGLIQPFGAIQPISEMQSRVFVKSMLDPSLLPSRSEMEIDIQKVREFMRKRYVISRRHTFQVDGVVFMDELAKIIGVTPPSFRQIICNPGLWWFLPHKYIRGVFPYQYRMVGPNKWEGAKDAILSASANQTCMFDHETSASAGVKILHKFRKQLSPFFDSLCAAAMVLMGILLALFLYRVKQ